MGPMAQDFAVTFDWATTTPRSTSSHYTAPHPDSRFRVPLRSCTDSAHRLLRIPSGGPDGGTVQPKGLSSGPPHHGAVVHQPWGLHARYPRIRPRRHLVDQCAVRRFPHVGSTRGTGRCASDCSKFGQWPSPLPSVTTRSGSRGGGHCVTPTRSHTNGSVSRLDAVCSGCAACSGQVTLAYVEEVSGEVAAMTLRRSSKKWRAQRTMLRAAVARVRCGLRRTAGAQTACDNALSTAMALPRLRRSRDASNRVPVGSLHSVCMWRVSGSSGLSLRSA